MKLSVSVAALVASAFLGSADFAHARGGGMEGGGGIGVRCGTKLELLDLHEARLKGKALITSPTTDEAAIKLISTKMATHFRWFTWDNFDSWLTTLEEEIVRPMYFGGEFLYPLKINGGVDYVMGQVKYVSALPLSTDVGTYIVQPGCKLEQIAYMSTKHEIKLEIVKEKWDELDGLSKAALIAHETFYFVDREMSLSTLLKLEDSKTSEWSREFVGKLFSNQPPPPLMAGVPSSAKILYCSSSSEISAGPITSFYLVNSKGGFRAIFEFLQGTNDLYQIIGDFKKAPTASATVKLNGNSAPTHLKVALMRQKNAQSFKLDLYNTLSAEKIGNSQEIGCGTVEESL